MIWTEYHRLDRIFTHVMGLYWTLNGVRKQLEHGIRQGETKELTEGDRAMMAAEVILDKELADLGELISEAYEDLKARGEL